MTTTRKRDYLYCHDCREVNPSHRYESAPTAEQDSWYCEDCGSTIVCDECGAEYSEAHAETHDEDGLPIIK